MEDAQQLTISSGLKNVPEIIHSMLYIYVLSQSPVCPCISLFCPSLSMIIKFCEELLHSSVIKNGIPRPSTWGLMFCILLLQSEQLAVWYEQYFPLYLYQRVWLWPWFMLASHVVLAEDFNYDYDSTQAAIDFETVLPLQHKDLVGSKEALPAWLWLSVRGFLSN